MLAISMLVFVVTGPTPDLFIDGFETGDLSKWDGVVPAPPTQVATGGAARHTGFTGMKFGDPDVGAGRSGIRRAPARSRARCRTASSITRSGCS
jgi:hypothetical protein